MFDKGQTNTLAFCVLSINIDGKSLIISLWTQDNHIDKNVLFHYQTISVAATVFKDLGLS
jgi:hypothetical protein